MDPYATRLGAKNRSRGVGRVGDGGHGHDSEGRVRRGGARAAGGAHGPGADEPLLVPGERDHAGAGAR